MSEPIWRAGLNNPTLGKSSDLVPEGYIGYLVAVVHDEENKEHPHRLAVLTVSRRSGSLGSLQLSTPKSLKQAGRSLELRGAGETRAFHVVAKVTN
jgi:hypothetical protein